VSHTRLPIDAASIGAVMSSGAETSPIILMHMIKKIAVMDSSTPHCCARNDKTGI